jgi:hypothetical protein
MAHSPVNRRLVPTLFEPPAPPLNPQDIQQGTVYYEPQEVQSDAPEWFFFPNNEQDPNFPEMHETVSCADWNCIKSLSEGAYMQWWFERLPRYKGHPEGAPYNSIWPYVFSIDCFPELP